MTWRDELVDTIDPDDEELGETPRDVVAVLGFDPLEFSDDTSLAWDPDQPREKSGSPEGGQWAPRDSFNVHISNEDMAKLRRLMPDSGMPEQDAARLAGAPNTANVTMSFAKSGNLAVNIDDNGGYKATRTISFSEKVIYNAFSRVPEQLQKTGIATKIFAKQVEAGVRLGFLEIQCDAARDDDMNGYYTWALFGFDNVEPFGDWAERHIRLYASEHDLLFLSDFMGEKRHRDWWLKNGDGFEATFDLREGSTSRKVLAEYITRKAAEKTTALAFDEDKHLRHAAGAEASKGGEFAPKGDLESRAKKYNTPGKPVGWAATASETERREAFDELLARYKETAKSTSKEESGDQYAFSEKRRLEAAERKIQENLATIRYAEFAVDKEGYTRARDLASLSAFVNDNEEEDFMKEVFDKGLTWKKSPYGGEDLHEKYGVKFSDIIGESWQEDVEKRYAKVAKEFSVSRELFDKATALRAKYAVESERHLRTAPHPAYYGEPQKPQTFKRSDAKGEVSSAVPEKVTRGGNTDEALDAFMQNGVVAVNVKDTGLKGIISSGQYKNRFEGGRGGVGKGNKDYKNARLDGENKMFGIGHDEDASRPIYGWIEHPDRVTSTGEDIGNNYGKHLVVLKPSIKSRSSYTIGDSLDDTGAYGRVVGAVNAPTSHIGIKESHWDASLPDDWRSQISAAAVSVEVTKIDALPKYDKGARTSRDDDASIKKRAEEIIARRQFKPAVNTKAGSTVDDFKINLDSGREIGVPRYVETQIWGGIKLDDIAEIRTTKGSLTPAQEKKLAKANIVVKYIPRQPKSTIYGWLKNVNWDNAIDDPS